MKTSNHTIRLKLILPGPRRRQSAGYLECLTFRFERPECKRDIEHLAQLTLVAGGFNTLLSPFPGGEPNGESFVTGPG
jgi:hypothetical protein